MSSADSLVPENKAGMALLVYRYKALLYNCVSRMLRHRSEQSTRGLSTSLPRNELILPPLPPMNDFSVLGIETLRISPYLPVNFH